MPQFLREDKNKENRDNDKDAELYDVPSQKIGNGLVITKIAGDIDNRGNECVQNNHKKRDMVISDVINDDHEADNDKDEELYIDHNQTKDQESDLEGVHVSKNFENAYNKEMMKQHNGENNDSEGNEAPFTDLTRTNYDEEDDPGFV